MQFLPREAIPGAACQEGLAILFVFDPSKPLRFTFHVGGHTLQTNALCLTSRSSCFGMKFRDVAISALVMFWVQIEFHVAGMAKP